MPTAIIIAANGFTTETTNPCLAAIADTTSPTTDPHRVFVFDRTPRAELTRAWNAGARLASEFGCETVCFLNNDTRPYPGWLAPLVDPAILAKIGRAHV